VEGISGLTFTFLYWKFGLGPELGVTLVYACLLIIVSVIDLEKHLILNRVTYPGMALALALSFFWPQLELISLLPIEALSRLISSLGGGALGLAIMVLPFIISRQGMGMGDVKLGALIGLMTGFPLVFIAVLISWVAGGLVAATLLTFKIKGRKDALPFAPFMATSAMVTLLWGEAIWQWYL